MVILMAERYYQLIVLLHVFIIILFFKDFVHFPTLVHKKRIFWNPK